MVKSLPENPGGLARMHIHGVDFVSQNKNVRLMNYIMGIGQQLNICNNLDHYYLSEYLDY